MYLLSLDPWVGDSMTWLCQLETGSTLEASRFVAKITRDKLMSTKMLQSCLGSRTYLFYANIVPNLFTDIIYGFAASC